MKNNAILIIGVAILLFGLFGNDINLPNLNIYNNTSVEYITEKPDNKELLDQANDIVDIIKSNYSDSSKEECLKLAALYYDLSILISLDKEDEVITDTASIQEANSLAGKMLKLDIKGKYPGLAEAAKNLVIIAIGEEDVSLNDESRSAAKDAFESLSWAFYQGAN